jgi:hypothetical protein
MLGLKVLSSENYGGSKLVSNERNCSSVGRWTFFFNFKGPSSSIFQKNVSPKLEPQLLVMWERIGEAPKVVYGAYPFTETCY